MGHNLHRRVAHELPPACEKTGHAVPCPQGVSSPGESEPAVAPKPKASSSSSKKKAAKRSSKARRR